MNQQANPGLCGRGSQKVDLCISMPPE